jgi:hypothetical protein
MLATSHVSFHYSNPTISRAEQVQTRQSTIEPTRPDPAPRPLKRSRYTDPVDYDVLHYPDLQADVEQADMKQVDPLNSLGIDSNPEMARCIVGLKKYLNLARSPEWQDVLLV